MPDNAFNLLGQSGRIEGFEDPLDVVALSRFEDDG